MKRILGWAIGAIILETVVYLEMLRFVGAPHDVDTAFAFFVVAFIVPAAFGFTFTLGPLAVAAVAVVTGVGAAYADTAYTFPAFVFSVVSALALAAFIASHPLQGFRVSWRELFVAYVIETAAIFGMVYLSALWPALLGIATLGGWLAAIHHRERHRRLAAA